MTSLHESKNEWGARLLTILTPLIVEGFQSIYQEAYVLCKENDETEKHLMTFQNFISRIPKWNPAIISNEVKRIVDKSGCSYLDDLVTCVHIIQLKLLTAVRVGSKQKKVDIVVPKIDEFIHKVYVFSARKLYKNVYLFEKNIPPLQVQKNHREMEVIIQECILNAVRESIPVEVLLRSYLDETVEDDVKVEIMEEEMTEKPIDEEIAQQVTEREINVKTPQPTIVAETTTDHPVPVATIPKRLEETPPMHVVDAMDNVPSGSAVTGGAAANNVDSRLHIGGDEIRLDHTDVHDLEPPSVDILPDLLLDDVEVL